MVSPAYRCMWLIPHSNYGVSRRIHSLCQSLGPPPSLPVHSHSAFFTVLSYFPSPPRTQIERHPPAPPGGASGFHRNRNARIISTAHRFMVASWSLSDFSKCPRNNSRHIPCGPRRQSQQHQQEKPFHGNLATCTPGPTRPAEIKTAFVPHSDGVYAGTSGVEYIASARYRAIMVTAFRSPFCSFPAPAYCPESRSQVARSGCWRGSVVPPINE